MNVLIDVDALGRVAKVYSRSWFVGNPFEVPDAEANSERGR